MRALALLALCVVLACSGDAPITPLSTPLLAAHAYAQAQRCMGRVTRADTLAPGVIWVTSATVPRGWNAEAGSYGGYTSPDRDTVLIAPGGEYDAPVLAHELLHVRYGYGHPDSLFGPKAQACGIAKP